MNSRLSHLFMSPPREMYDAAVKSLERVLERVRERVFISLFLHFSCVIDCTCSFSERLSGSPQHLSCVVHLY